MNRYNELQILYTKERFEKVPETSTGSRRRFDFPTGGGVVKQFIFFLRLQALIIFIEYLIYA